MLIVAAVVFACINTRFVQLANLSIMLQEVAVIGLLALGQSLIILTAGIDLSVGAAMILSQMVMAGLAVNSGVPAALAIIIGLIAALVTGLVNGAARHETARSPRSSPHWARSGCSPPSG